MSNLDTPPVVRSSPISAGTSSSDDSNRSLFAYALIALGLALFIRFFIATPYIVAGASMENTFQNFDYLIIDRLTYDFASPQRGDVIVFGLPHEPSRDLIKRVIGLPGDTVSLSDNKIIIRNATHPEGFSIAEPYLSRENLGGTSYMKVTLGPDQYFVLGDNRKVSADSRVWGTLPRRDIVGRVFLRLFPFSMIALFPGEARYVEK